MVIVSHNDETSTTNLETNTRQAYTSLAEYAAVQGAPAAAFVAFGWSSTLTEKRDSDGDYRPALKFHTPNGDRWRFMDGAPRPKQKYTSAYGFERCWYGLDSAVQIAQDTGQLLIIANGEASIVVGQYHGLAVACVSGGGETPTFTPELISQLQERYTGRVLIAYDCDNTGRDNAPRLAVQLRAAGFEADAIDLQLGKNGDVANFCKLHGSDAARLIADCPTLPDPPIVEQPRREQREQARPTSGDVDWQYENRLWWVNVVRPAVEAATPRHKGKKFQCINPHHTDEHPSARISPQKDPDGIYVCTCGAHSRSTVASWLGLPTFIEWWKEHRRPEKSTRGVKRQTEKTPLDDLIHDRAEYAPPAADVTGSAQYVTGLPIPDGDVLLISDTGTGKTTWAKGQGIDMNITHRTALSTALAEQLDMENYQGLTGAQMHQVNKLTACLNSIKKCANRRVGTLFLDEFRQLLAHLGGDTFTGSEAETAYNVLIAMIQRAERVIAADADADETTIQLLKKHRPGLQVVLNTRPRDRNGLTLWEHRDGLIGKLWTLVDENAGCVFVPTGSAALAKDLEREAIERYGAENVMALYQEVSSDPARRAFLRHANEQINNYRVFITSPTTGSGIDIQAPIRATVGFFMHEPLAAPDCHQMLNRCRNTRETHVYIRRQEGNSETDANAIYERAERNAIATGHVAHFDAHGLTVMTDGQRDLHHLQAELEAADNASKNRLLEHFLELARGYSSITTCEAKDSAALEKTIEQREQRKEEEKARTLAAVAITPDEFKTLVDSGKNTPDHAYGLRRYQIEKASGKDITSPTYDLLHSHEGRAALYLLTDHLHGRIEALAQADRDESTTPLGKRHHYTRRKILLDDLIKRVFGRDGLRTGLILHQDHIIETVGDFLAVSGDEFHRAFNRRSDLSKGGRAVLAWVLDRLGLKLEIAGRERDENDKKRYLYRVESKSLATMLELAASCYARQVQDSDARRNVSQNVYQGDAEIQDLGHTAPPVHVRRVDVDAMLKKGRNPNPFAHDYDPIYRQTEAV
jgi:hypothetical protein